LIGITRNSGLFSIVFDAQPKSALEGAAPIRL